MKKTHCAWSKKCKRETNEAGIPYCALHYHAKEANYAIHDLEHLKEFTSKDRKFWKKISIERLLDFAKYFRDNE